MLSVGQRIQEAIDHMGKGEIMRALTPACIALDITSQRHAGAKRSGRAIFKRFVTEHMWLISYLGFPGLMSSIVRVPFSHPDVKPDAAGTVGIDDIVYHIIRCGLIHSDETSAKIVWSSALALGLDNHGNLVLHQDLVWALIATVVFAPVNKSESVPETYWIQIGGFKSFVSEYWGRIDLAKRIVQHNTGIPVK